MKKILLLFAVLLTLSVTTYAQNPNGIQVFVDGDWTYTINPDADHEVTVVHYGGEEGSNATELTIPSHATYNETRYTVTALGEGLFSNFNNEGNDQYTHWWEHRRFMKLEKVTIPNTVTNIEKYAFGGCGLKSVTIPNSVVEIGSGAFQQCSSLTSVSIPNSVTEIGSGAFSRCSSLISVIIPNSVKRIDYNVFSYCSSLSSVTIPESVTEIIAGAFSGCDSLNEILVSEENITYASADGILFSKDMTSLIRWPGAKTVCNIPNSVTKIGDSAFSDCSNLTSVTIPNSVTEIGGSAFYGCSNLTSVSIPNSVTEIGRSAFYGCSSLTSVTIPNSVTSIVNNPFVACTSLQEIVLQDGNKNYKTIDGVLYDHNISKLIIYPAGKGNIFEIPNSVTEIGDDAFSRCSILTSVTIPNSVTKIGSNAFSFCSSLTSVTIPNSVTKIESGAFSDCSALTTVFALPMTPPSCSSSSFLRVPETSVVYIPKGTFKAYSEARGWNHFTDFREMGALDITLSEATISIEEGKTATISATVTKDDDVTVESETWASSNTEVATVDNGIVTAVAEGTATITYTVVDGYGCPHTEYCEVTVSANTGIEDIIGNESNAPAEFFNLNGVRVNADHLTPGLYIKRQDGKATKVLVK